MEFEIKFDKVLFTELLLIGNHTVEQQDETLPQWKTNLNIHTDFVDTHKFRITFQLHLTNEINNNELKLTAISFFSTNQKITTEFQDSQLVTISAPAIAFPYIRAFVSNLTLNSWQNPILLPMLNFVSMANSVVKENPSKITE